MARILLIDDDPEFSAALAVHLRATGHEVHCESNGIDGARSFSARQGEAVFELVIVDIYMPEHDGVETITAIRADSQKIPIIAISGVAPHGDFDMLSFATRFGADIAVAKASALQVILENVDALTGSQR